MLEKRYVKWIGDCYYVDGVLTSCRMVHMLDCIKAGQLEAAHQLMDTCNVGDLSRMLKVYGFKELGMGSYSVVFQIPGENTVIKLNHCERDKWWVYAEHAKEIGNANPMLPKVYELYSNPETGMTIARVEKLTSANISIVTGMYKVVNALGGDLRKETLTKRGLRNNALKYLRSWFDIDRKYAYSQINLAKIVIWLTGHIKSDYSDIGCDFHGANWMLRGNQLVLNDPIA